MRVLILFIPFVHSCSFIVANHDISNLEYANELNKRRGPDQTNTKVVEGWTFVHNILHMTGEFTLQPFCKNDICTVFNGEIYSIPIFEKLKTFDNEITKH